MSKPGKDADQEQTSNSVQAESERSIKSLLEALKDFEHRFTVLLQGRKFFKLRLEIQGDKGQITEVDVNEFVKSRPHHDPKPVKY